MGYAAAGLSLLTGGAGARRRLHQEPERRGERAMTRRRMAGAVLLAWLCSTAIFASCSSDETMNTSSATGSASGGGAAFGAGACRKCERAACAAEFSACEAEPECGTFIGCESACPIALTGDV